MFSVRVLRRCLPWLGALVAMAAFVPAVAGARTLKLGPHMRVQLQNRHYRSHHGARQAYWRGHMRSYGATTLTLDPGTASALQQLGVTVAPVAPASAGANSVSFPITDPLLQAAVTRQITHSGGISLSAGSTTVDLTNFDINLGSSSTLSAEVGGSRVTILNLDLSGARLRLGYNGLTIGPVVARLTPAAATALNTAFGVTAFTPGLELGTANINYCLFGLY